VGLGCATDAMLRISRHREGLRRIRVQELDLRFDIWLIRPPHTGALALAIHCFEEVLAKRFSRGQQAA
jgi:hypothetical protein